MSKIITIIKQTIQKLDTWDADEDSSSDQARKAF